MSTTDKIRFEDVRIGFKNFAGLEGPYNKEGDRSFAIFIDDLDFANSLAAQGWNIKFPKPNENIDPEEDTRTPYLQVAVTFGQFPPKIVMLQQDAETGELTKTYLDEQSVSILDKARFDTVDVMVRPYNWTVNGDTGIKAYVYQIYATVSNEGFDERYGFEAKYGF